MPCAAARARAPDPAPSPEIRPVIADLVSEPAAFPGALIAFLVRLGDRPRPTIAAEIKTRAGTREIRFR